MKKTLLLVSFCLIGLTSCKKTIIDKAADNESVSVTESKFNNIHDAYQKLANTEWVDNYIVDHYLYFDNSGNVYTNYYKPGNYNSSMVIKYRLGDAEMITGPDGEKSYIIPFVGQSVEEYGISIGESTTNEMIMIDAGASGDDGFRIIKKIN